MMCWNKHITIFDREYTMEQQAEGIAVSEAVVFGACDRCESLARCSTDVGFRPPADAWCVKRKAGILADWNADGERRTDDA